MKQILIGLLLILPLSGEAQEAARHCAQVKGGSRNLQQDRSNTLTPNQIAITEQYDVHFYKLDLNVERTTTDLSGVVEIHANVVAPLPHFLFELHEDLVIDSITINGSLNTGFVRNGSAVSVPVNLTIGDHVKAVIYYGGSPPNQATNPLSGGGITNDYSTTWGNQVTWTLSEPFSAYEWWPCKQSLTDKADSVYVYLTTDSTNKAGANGLLQQVVDLGDGRHRYEWQSNYPIDYYLISFSVAQYIDYSIYANPVGATNPILIQNYIYNNPQTLVSFQAEIDHTVDFVEYFSGLYGLYPFEQEKYGHCMAPLGGGMEHQTMTTQGWFDDDLTAHELGHQWFGDHVTCATWADIWLNEGFATYTSYLMYAQFYPGNEVQTMSNTHISVMDQPYGAVWVEDSLNTSRIFSGRLTYNKGSAIVHTLRFLIDDDDVFFNILKTYLNQYGGGTARVQDFKNIAEQLSGLDLTDFFDQWYYGEGYPTYSVEYNFTGTETVIEVSHSASWPNVTPTFTNDLELRLVAQNGSVATYRIPITGNVTNYAVPFEHPIANVHVDPNNWIVNKVGTVQENLELASIQEQENFAFAYHPNPFVDKVVIESGKSGELLVYTVDGQLLKQVRIVKGNNEIDLTDFSAGHYILSFRSKQIQLIKS